MSTGFLLTGLKNGLSASLTIDDTYLIYSASWCGRPYRGAIPIPETETAQPLDFFAQQSPERLAMHLTDSGLCTSPAPCFTTTAVRFSNFLNQGADAIASSKLFKGREIIRDALARYDGKNDDLACGVLVHDLKANGLDFFETDMVAMGENPEILAVARDVIAPMQDAARNLSYQAMCNGQDDPMHFALSAEEEQIPSYA